eukprot:TRINITY_DN4324_c0_g1_i1.p1 TRINITY_DN4324_c0_g1~~TRINITY_DN4324_c0_g1_i1.p1  ORF type:complete len:150 (+),score=14.65 TRINITY_DN4324_c0_g1_i1:1036-1485(+)
MDVREAKLGPHNIGLRPALITKEQTKSTSSSLLQPIPMLHLNDGSSHGCLTLAHTPDFTFELLTNSVVLAVSFYMVIDHESILNTPEIHLHFPVQQGAAAHEKTAATTFLGTPTDANGTSSTPHPTDSGVFFVGAWPNPLKAKRQLQIF